MKKLFVIIIFLLVSGMIFAGEFIHSIWSLGTSSIFYGDPEEKNITYDLKKQDYVNLILTGEYGARIQLDKKIDFVATAYLTMDSLANKGSSLLRLDYGISGGVRLRPGIGGINLGCEYCTGQRADIDMLGKGKPQTSATQWGNGCRFMFEYDFSALLTGIAPVIGISYRTVPRGNNFRDGNLAFYFRLIG